MPQLFNTISGRDWTESLANGRQLRAQPSIVASTLMGALFAGKSDDEIVATLRHDLTKVSPETRAQYEQQMKKTIAIRGWVNADLTPLSCEQAVATYPRESLFTLNLISRVEAIRHAQALVVDQRPQHSNKLSL